MDPYRGHCLIGFAINLDAASVLFRILTIPTADEI